MAALLAMSRVRVLARWLDSSEIGHRSRTINGVPRPRRIEIRVNTGSYVHVWCEKGPQQRSAMSLRCTEVMETTQNKAPPLMTSTIRQLTMNLGEGGIELR